MKFNKYVEKIEHEYKHLSELTTEMCTFCKELQHNEHYLAKDKETQEKICEYADYISDEITIARDELKLTLKLLKNIQDEMQK